MRFIEAGEIKALSRELQKAYLQKYERDAIRIKLDRIADERRFDGSIVTGENGADTDEALGLLRGHGELFVCESVIQNHGISSSHTEQYSYIQGLIMLGLPDEDIGKLADSFEKGELPIDVIDAVVIQQERIKSLHPDKYPFPDTAYDVIADGLSRTEINTKSIWQGVEGNLRARGRADLALIYGYAPPTESLTGFLAHFALTKHDIGELNRTKRELHF